MGIIEYFKEISNRIKKFGSTVFVEDQFVETNNREDLKGALASVGMTGKDGAELVKSLDDANKIGKNFVEKEEASIQLTPADREEELARTDSTISHIKDGVEATGKYDKEQRNAREHGGKVKEK